MRHLPNVQAPRRTGAFSLVPLLLFTTVTLISFWVATQWTAAHLAYQPQLGSGWFSFSRVTVYAPWAIFGWEYFYSAYAENLFRMAFYICVAGPLIGVIVLVGYAVWRARKARVATTHGSARWATEDEYAAAGLLGDAGVIVGATPDGRYLRDNGPEHVACIAPTRSGKGVGQVIPTLLTWPGSVLVHDMKGENWARSSAWRARFSNVMYFNPTDPSCSAHFNPLLEVRRDENQIRDVQNIADLLVDPHGKGKESHWDRTADQFFLGAILHVLHAEPDQSLYGVSKFLTNPKRTFEQTLKLMKGTPHDRGLAHERIASAAQAMLNKSEEERSGILSTALSFLGLYSDPIVARNTSSSDFRILDLMQGDHPMSLYLVVPDSDRLRLKPLIRLMMTMITQRLVEVLNPKENKHRLLMLVDEFPRLSRMPFFADALSYVAGYNIKVMLIMQSKGQLDAPDSYGKGNTIIESCRVRCVYTPQDPDTAQWISDALGPKTEVHQQTTYTGHRLAPWLGHVMVADQESARPLLDAAEVCKMSATDAIVLVAGFPPFKAKRVKYYEDPVLAERAALPALKLTSDGPYPFRPRPRPNAWTNPPRRQRSPGTADPPSSPVPTTPRACEVVIPLEERGITAAPEESDDEPQLQLQLDDEATQQQARALDERDRLERRRHGKRLRIPL